MKQGETSPLLSERERQRYHRQILLIGEEGQERLKRSRVFIAGAGGLGSPVAMYLAAAGTGILTLADHDAVDLSNLNRQVLHWDADVGRPKTESAVGKLRAMNPDIEIRAIDRTIDRSNVDELTRGYDMIVDAMDNYPTRYLLNRAAIRHRIPFIHGAIRGFDGQVMTVIPGKTACLRCIFPSALPAEQFPVIGVTPGIIGLIQANEVIKFLLGTGELLGNRLLIWDGLRSTLDRIEVQRNPACPDCGEMEKQP
ncbi:MAG: HesA/MoeB/ThiF family protein [Methanomicrobiales archaeon]|nr:HesA/MoeB/ThiF family protein [Methanomicrobiales archaeon]